MTRRYYANTAPQLTTTGSISNAATSVTVSAAPTGWPSSFPYFAAFEVGMANMEIVLVTNAVGSTLTITRGQDGTSGVAHASGVTIDHVFVAKDLDEPNAHIQATTGIHGISGVLVGTTDAQTLSAKTLIAPVVTGGIDVSGAATFEAGVTVVGAGHVESDLTVDGHLILAGTTFDPLAVGSLKAMSMDPLAASGTASLSSGWTWYGRIIQPGQWTISAIGLQEQPGATGGVSVSVAVFHDNGSNAPGTIVAQSGAVTTTTALSGSLSLGATVTVKQGDWIAVASTGSQSFKGNTSGATWPSWRACFASGTTPGALASNPSVGSTNLAIALWGI